MSVQIFGQTFFFIWAGAKSQAFNQLKNLLINIIGLMKKV